jgi:hypothetical protein
MVRMVLDAGRGFLRALIVYIIKHIDRRTWTVPLKLKLKYKVKFKSADAEARRVDTYFVHQTILLHDTTVLFTEPGLFEHACILVSHPQTETSTHYSSS